MNTYAPNMMGSQLADVPYLTGQFSMEPLTYSIPDSNILASAMKRETLDHLMGGTFDEFDLRGHRSLSFSGTSSQSLSPQPPHRQTGPPLPDLGLSNTLFDVGMDQISRTTSMSTSRKDSIDEDHRAEVSTTTQHVSRLSEADSVDRDGGLRTELPSVPIGSARIRV